jgi:hypothetical protein
MASEEHVAGIVRIAGEGWIKGKSRVKSRKVVEETSP